VLGDTGKIQETVSQNLGFGAQHCRYIRLYIKVLQHVKNMKEKIWGGIQLAIYRRLITF